MFQDLAGKKNPHQSKCFCETLKKKRCAEGGKLFADFWFSRRVSEHTPREKRGINTFVKYDEEWNEKTEVTGK
jgi:hypothetical protein